MHMCMHIDIDVYTVYTYKYRCHIHRCKTNSLFLIMFLPVPIYFHMSFVTKKWTALHITMQRHQLLGSAVSVLDEYIKSFMKRIIGIDSR